MGTQVNARSVSTEDMIIDFSRFVTSPERLCHLAPGPQSPGLIGSRFPEIACERHPTIEGPQGETRTLDDESLGSRH